MTAFSRVGVVWSSAHYGLMTTVLRGEWGMDGFAVSDYTTSGVATTAHDRTTYDPYLAVIAGTDTFDSSMKTSQYKTLKALDYQNDPHMVNAMRQACHRMLYTIVNSNAMNGVTPLTKMINVMVWWQMALADGIIYCGIVTIVMLSIATAKQIKYSKYKKETATETTSGSAEDTSKGE